MDDFADELAGAAGKDDLGGVIGEWLLDRKEVDDVFAADEALGAVVLEQARAVAEEPEAEPEPEPEPEAEPELGGFGGDLMRELLAPIDPGELDRQVWMAQWSRHSFTPVTREGDGPVGASKFGGAALLPRGESWPACPGCDKPMNLFVQLDLAELPEHLPHAHREGLVQLFYCTSLDPACETTYEAWQPFAESSLARWLPAERLAEPTEPAHNPTGAPAVLLTGWTEGPLELPAYEDEVDEPAPEDLEELEDEAYAPRTGDKVGGWPAWVQGPEYPKCPQCKQKMEYLLQLDSNGLCHHQFGDLGTGHLFQCIHHPEVVAFGWACH